MTTPHLRRERERSLEVAEKALGFGGLSATRDHMAKNLPDGLQRRLEIARALAAEPVLLLLDEPAAGMNPSEVDSLLRLILRIRDRGITVILIEHQMRLAMAVADQVAVFDHGAKIF